MSDDFEFGFGDGDDHLRGRVKRFKAEKNRTYRVGMTWFKGIEDDDYGLKNLDWEAQGMDSDVKLTPMFKGAKRVYLDNVGYVIVDTPEIEAICKQVAPGKKINTYAATVIASWPLDSETGKPSKDIFNPKRVMVQPWVLNLNHYNNLKKYHMRGFPMHSADMGLELHPEKPVDFQDFQFFPQAGAIFKQLLGKAEDNDDAKRITQHVINATRAIVPNILDEIGRRYTPDELRDALGIGGASSVTDFGGGVSSQDGAEVGGLIEGMLE